MSEFDYYMDTHKLRITVSNMKNANSEQELMAMRDTILQNLGSLPPVPSVQFAPIAPKHDLVRIPRLCCCRTLCLLLGMVLEASELRMLRDTSSSWPDTSSIPAAQTQRPWSVAVMSQCRSSRFVIRGGITVCASTNGAACGSLAADTVGLVSSEGRPPRGGPGRAGRWSRC